MNLTLRCLFVALALVLPGVGAGAKDYEVVTRPNLEFVQHDGANLAGDLYLPKGLDKAPVIIAAHGGGWQVGTRASYRYWGPFLARNGYAVFSIDYRLGKAGTYPGQDKDNPNSVVWNLLVTGDKMSDEMAYTIVKTIFDKQADLIAVHREAENFDLKGQLKSNSPSAWHPGALKYFAERGVVM